MLGVRVWTESHLWLPCGLPFGVFPGFIHEEDAAWNTPVWTPQARSRVLPWGTFQDWEARVDTAVPSTPPARCSPAPLLPLALAGNPGDHLEEWPHLHPRPLSFHPG